LVSAEEFQPIVRKDAIIAKTHVNRAMMKLGARDRAQLVVIAYQSGLVRPGQK
jgi:hypothetical protein